MEQRDFEIFARSVSPAPLLRPHPQRSCRLPSIRHALHFVASISLRYIHVIAPSIRSALPIAQQPVKKFQRFLGWRDASMSANSQTVVVFSEITSGTDVTRARSPFFLPQRRQLIDPFSAHQVRRHELRQVFRRALFEFHSLLFPIVRASTTAAACRSPAFSPSPHSTTRVLLLRQHLPQFMR